MPFNRKDLTGLKTVGSGNGRKVGLPVWKEENTLKVDLENMPEVRGQAGG